MTTDAGLTPSDEREQDEIRSPADITPDTAFNSYSRMESRDEDELDEFREWYADALEDVGAEWTMTADYYNEDLRAGAVEFDFDMTLAQVFEWPEFYDTEDIANSIEVLHPALVKSPQDGGESLVRTTRESVRKRIDGLRREHWERKVLEVGEEEFAETLVAGIERGMLDETHLARIRRDLENTLPLDALAPLLSHPERRVRLYAQTLAADALPGPTAKPRTPGAKRGRSR